MKQITLIQDGASPLVIEDNDDDKPLDKYTEELCTVMNSNNISIIEVSSCSVITRPSKITSIIVREFSTTSTDEKETPKDKQEKIEGGDDSIDGIISD